MSEIMFESLPLPAGRGSALYDGDLLSGASSLREMSLL